MFDQQQLTREKGDRAPTLPSSALLKFPSIPETCYLVAMPARCALVLTAFLLLGTLVAQERRPRLDLPLQSGTAVIEFDQLDRVSGVYVATGNVVITYQDSVLKADRIDYNPVTREALLVGNVDVRRGIEWLKASRAEVNLETGTGTFYEVDGFSDEELFIRASAITKTGPDTYVAQDPIITSCSDAIPKWSFRTSTSQIRLDAWARGSNAVLRIKKVPVFYLPYVVVPTAKRKRQSGFLMPTMGNSSNKGRRFSQSFYLTLGRSADIVYNQDYFSKRGLGYGFIFRARPNAVSRIELDGYAVDDRLDQGGASLKGSGETRFSGYRAVAVFNLVSSFEFRQVFSDNFFAATQSSEESELFVSKSERSHSINFLFSREETAFPGPNAVIRTRPSVSFRLSAQQIPKTPLYLDLDAAAGGFSRSDSELETPGVTQRFDFFPQIYTSLPLFQGLKVTPRVAFRYTYYSDSLDEVDREVSSKELNRDYLDFTLDLKGWGLSKIYRSESGEARWKHLIEPTLRYRYIAGIDEFDRTLRFDEVDAVADTNEVEVALWNRFFVRRNDGNHEWLSIKIAQKYFFNSDFGGALTQGRVNQFFPLYTLTGFPYAAIVRNSSPVTLLARIRPGRRINFDVRADYDPDFNRFRNFSVTGALSAGPVYFGTTYFTTREIEPGTFLRNQIQGQVALGTLKNGPSVSGIFSYDVEASRFLNTGIRANYFWDCCGVSLEYQGFSLGGVADTRLRDERQIRFSFFFKGVGHFGTIQRPSRVF